MIKKTITYTDYNDLQRTEDFYFHLTEAELTELSVSVTGGLAALLEKIVKENDQKQIWEYMKILVNKSYGVKSADGRQFQKDKNILDAFAQTEAYSMLLMELSSDAESAAAFANGILPKKLSEKVAAAK